jgi:spore germination cell wall hydrolase CwlJ-like protein
MRRRSNASWAVGVIAPWCLGFGLLISFTASAGQDAVRDWSQAPLTARATSGQESPSLASALFGDIEAGPRVELALLTEGTTSDLRQSADEREPHVELKPNIKNFPEVDRSRKGDPVVAIRPSFESRLPPVAPAFAFSDAGKRMPTLLAPRAALPGGEETPEGFETHKEPSGTTQKGVALASPAQAGSVSTPASIEAARARAAHGATPQVPRAVALSSSTPAQPDAVPIEVSSFPRATLALQAGKNTGRPDYASMIDPEKMSSEKRCLAEAVYFEARSEPEAGQAAVAQVVLNRVSSGLYPSSICGVVYQNRHHYKGCQFSFACEGKSLRITERDAWMTALRIADEVLAGRTYISDVGRSTHYHANYVRPRWARSLKKMDVIGRHVFYRLKTGPT